MASDRRLYTISLKVSRRPKDLSLGEADDSGSIVVAGLYTSGKYVHHVSVSLNGIYADWPDSAVWAEVRKMYERSI